MIFVQNSARGKQSERRRSSRLLTALSAEREPKFLIASDNPTRIVIPSDQRESKGLPSRSLPLEPSGARRVHPAPILCSADGSRDARVLIGTLGISGNELSCTKERRKQNPNRDKIAFSGNSAAHVFSLEISARAHRLPIISASAPLSSALNLAIIDSPVRGHL